MTKPVLPRATDQSAQVLSADVSAGLTREEAYALLSRMAETTIKGIKEFPTQPRTYVMCLGNNARLELRSEDLLNQAKFAKALFEYAHHIMPSFKPVEWNNFKKLISACIEVMEPADEAKYSGEVISWLCTYMRKHLRPEMARNDQLRAVLEGMPALIDGEVLFTMEGFKHSILLESSTQPPSHSVLAVRLQQIGCVYHRQKDIHVDGSHTTRSLWRASAAFADTAMLLPQSEEQDEPVLRA